MTDVRQMLRDLLDEYRDWVQPYDDPQEPGKERCPEPFLGQWRPGKVDVMFLGINPGGQSCRLRRSVDEHLAHAAEYFRSPEAQRDRNIWALYGHFFEESPATADGCLTGDPLFEALATRSLVTNVIHWPTRRASGRYLPAKVKRTWIPRGGRHVERLIALARPKLIVVHHTDAFQWLFERLCERPWQRRPAVESLWRNQEQPPVFRSTLRIPGLTPDYRPSIVPALHLSGYPRYAWLLSLYRQVPGHFLWSD